MGCSRFWCLLAFRQAAYFWQYLKAKMVPTERFELSTSPLPRECSTSELCGRGAASTCCSLPPCDGPANCHKCPCQGKRDMAPITHEEKKVTTDRK